MTPSISKYLEEIEAFKAKTSEEIEAFRIRFLGRKGLVKTLAEELKKLPNEEKRNFGQAINTLKSKAQEKLDVLTSNDNKGFETPRIDVSRPTPAQLGSRHPLSMVRDKIIGLFTHIGFSVADGPEIEDDWHNFTALNFPPDHPARDMQDTFFLSREPEIALRTHTSSVQVRVMENQRPPIRILAPGRVYRNEAISARAHCFFHQVEGFYVDKGVSFADLKFTIDYFAKSLFGENAHVRMRPSYFPFTEPSAEIDVSCTICHGKGCNVCKYTGWLEIMGCGMIDPRVLRNCNIDPEEYSGFAFGMGVERIAQLLFRVNDLRLYSENDARFLEEFTSFR